MWRADSLEKTLMLGRIEGKQRRGQQRMRWLGGITDSMDMSLSKPWWKVEDRRASCAVVHGAAKSRTRLRDWTTTKAGDRNLPAFWLVSRRPPRKKTWDKAVRYEWIKGDKRQWRWAGGVGAVGGRQGGSLVMLAGAVAILLGLTGVVFCC